MSVRHNRSRFVASILVIAVVSIFTFASLGGKLTGLLTTTTSAESVKIEEPASPPAIGVVGTCSTAGPVEVESSGGTTAPTAYATLNDSFAAIIAGTHTGSINIEVCGNTTETASATLTASGIGATSYTSVTIRPLGGARVIEGSIAGAVIRLNGADNVTIDGRQGGAGTARDLTVRNNSTAAATAAIWLSSVAALNGASNNVIRNLELAAGANMTASDNSTFGIIMSGTAISTTTNGIDNDNNSFVANRIIRARYGIVTRGTTTDLNISPVITDNIIGPASFGPDQIGKTGILVQADTGALISRNTIQNVGCQIANTCTGADRVGIGIGSESWSATDATTITSTGYTVTRNTVNNIVEEKTFSSVGIKLGTTQGGSATNNLVANNFISNVRANGTSGDQVVGIGISGGLGDRVVFNSISLTGDMDPGASAASTTYGNAIRIPGANGSNNGNFVITNNSIYLDASSSSTAAQRYYAITLNSNAYSFGTGALNNNNYYINPSNTQLQTGGLGTGTASAATSQFATLANWQAALTAPQDANSIQADPLYFSSTSDLHIQITSPNITAGTAVAGVIDDIDGQARPNGAGTDIGADEFYASAGSVQLTSATYSVTEAAGIVTITATRTGGANGAVSVDFSTVAGGTATGAALCGGSADYNPASGTLTWADLDVAPKTFTITVCNDGASEPSETVNLGITNPTGGVALGTPNTAVLTILNSTAFGGSISVGTSEGITSLTNAGGLFEQINNGSITANTTVNITSDLTAETGAVALNQFAGGFSLTIQPSGGAARIISGNNSTALLNFNGADNITIDGLGTGGNSLTVRSTGTGAAILFINDASNNLVTRSTLEANSNSSVIFISTGVTTGNDNNSIVANTITGRSDAVGAPFNAINLIGTSAAVSNSNTLINNNAIVNFLQAGIVIGTSDNVTFTNNDISQSASRTTSLFGVAVNSAAGTNLVSGNSIHDLTTTLAVTGLAFNDARDTTVSRNRVFNIPSTSGSTGTLTGILSNGSSGNPASLTIVNNSVSIAPAFTNAQNIFGIRDFGFALNAFTAYYNTVLIGGTGSGASNTWACQRGFSAPTNFTMIDNLCFNNRTGGTGNHFSAGDQSANTGTFVSNYNIFVGTGATAANHFDKATSSTSVPVDFAAWQAGPPARDANSQASNPGVGNYTVGNMFVSTTDLHLANEGTNPASNAGTPITGVTTDFDGNSRSATTPEIGFDEIGVLPTVQFNSATYSGAEGANATITVTRTGDTSGASAVNFATSDGTATGGASCGAGVDYVSNSGTLNFAATETSKTFNVQLCSDAVSKGDETINLTLSAPVTATLGSPSTAVLTITNVAPPMAGVLALSSATYSVGESSPTVTITINRTGGTDGAVSVNYALADGTATGGAACAAGIDYVNTGGTVNFANGQASQTFMVAICNDGTIKSNETFTVTLSGPTGGATVGSPSVATVTITDDDTPPAGNVVVNPGNVAYTTLGEAVAAINAGTHTGAVTVDINASTTETGPIVLNGSGAGSASYTSLVIRPAVDGVTVAGPTATGRGLLELNGADNVTIDGDNPNTGGTNRNLTFQNTAANTVTFTSVIRIALAITVVNSADNDVVRNLNIVGSSSGRNIPAATSTTASENTTFGILAGTGASTTTATAAPAAIVSVSTGVAAGATANNLTITNNNIVTAARAVSINGTATSVFPGLQINGNLIGNPVAGNVDQVTAMGIVVSGSTNAVMGGNTVYVEGFVAASASTHGIDVGTNSTAINGATIENNHVDRVRNNNGQTWAAYGISLAGGNTHVVRNNFVSGIMNDQTAGTGGFGTTFGAYGIRVGAGTGHQIYHNSVHLYGPLAGVTSTDLTAAFMIVAATQTGMDVRNNIFSNQITGGNPTGTRHVAVFLPSGATSAMNLTMNNNAYYQGTDPLSRLAQVGGTINVGEYLAENFDPTATTPASNFRAYTSTLSAAGTNDNASFATTAPPPFVSNTNLHIPAGTPTRLESGGAAVGVTIDIDAEARNATTPDIGADEFAGAPAAANDMAATAFVVPANGSTIPTGGLTPQARFTNFGTATQTNVTVRFKIIDSSMATIYNQTAVIASIAPLQSVVVSFPATTISAAGAFTMQASSELAGDQNTANDTINGSFNTVAAINGTINVGTGETYTSLTNPGGVFQALNTAGISGNVVVNITSDLTAETGAVGLNQLLESGAGGYTVTFRPSGAARVISGTAPANTGLINLNGADRIIFDGSLAGGTDRSLTITNNQTGLSTVIWMKSIGSNGSTNNTVKNCIINGAVGANATTTAGILTGSGATLGNDAEAPNSNNTVNNNWIYRVQNSLYLRGGLVAANFDQNWVVTGNELGSNTAGNRNSFRGMLIGNSQNFMIAGNLVHGVQSTTTTTASMSGIQIGLLVNGGLVANNIIHEIKNVSATGTGANGIHFISTSTASNVTVANNFVYDVTALGSATLASNGFGINVSSGAGYKIYHNSVNMNTDQSSGTTAAMIVQSTVTVAGALDIRNNIFANTQTAGATRYAFYSGAANTVYTPINYNDYFSTGSVGFLGSARATLAEWQAATGQDANSKAVDPLFVSATNLHIQNASPMVNMGVAGTGITTDIDGQARDANPDIGADENVGGASPGSLQFSSATYSVGEAGPVATITVTRTGGTDGTVTVQYATTNGTATGGASCGAGVDYVTTSGTLTFIAGDASETFSVPICSDAAVEGNETFNVALSSPGGGAVIGSPSAAVVTITDDDAGAGTLSINDVRMFEGNSGTRNFMFTVTYSGPAVPVSVQYATANGTAVAGVDYLTATGTLNFNSSSESQTVTVVVNSDTLKEANETFFVNLSSPTGATISDGQGVGVIIDEDRAYVADFDLDKVSDFSVFRPSEGRWYVLRSASASLDIVTFGTTGDVAVPGDYDADGITDYALWRPSTGQWFRTMSSNGSQSVTSWGSSGDKPVQGDYDGDGKTDLAVFRPSTGTWWILRSSNGATSATPFGIGTDRPVQGDYDGDAKTDIAVYRDGAWYIARSSDGAVQIASFGIASDTPVSGDFDGDGRFDLAIYRGGVWWSLSTLTGTAVAVPWGNTTDIPVPADYDGDGTTDRAIFRPSTGDWFILRSSNNTSFGIHWGANGDVPVPSAYLPQ